MHAHILFHCFIVHSVFDPFQIFSEQHAVEFLQEQSWSGSLQLEELPTLAKDPPIHQPAFDNLVTVHSCVNLFRPLKENCLDFVSSSQCGSPLSPAKIKKLPVPITKWHWSKIFKQYWFKRFTRYRLRINWSKKIKHYWFKMYCFSEIQTTFDTDLKDTWTKVMSILGLLSLLNCSECNLWMIWAEAIFSFDDWIHVFTSVLYSLCKG